MLQTHPLLDLSPQHHDRACSYRHQWFQTQSVVEVAVLAKNMTKERVDIHIDQQHLRVVIKDAEGQQEYELDVELYGQVSYISFLSPSPVAVSYTHLAAAHAFQQ